MADTAYEEYPKSNSWVKVDYITTGFQAKNPRGFEYGIKTVDSLPLDTDEIFTCVYLETVTYSIGNFLYVRNKEQNINITVRV